MPDIICVKSETTSRVVRVRPGDLALRVGDRCIIESELGGDLALVVDETSSFCHNPKAARTAVQVIRKATPEDVRKFDWLREREARAYDLCIERIAVHNLAMKLVAVRYFFSEKKGLFYYTADGRIVEVFSSFVRDILLLRLGGDPALLLNPDFEERLRDAEPSWSPARILGVLAELDYLSAQLDGNLNKGLLAATFFSNFGELRHA